MSSEGWTTTAVWSRRSLLAASVVTGTGWLAGCSGNRSGTDTTATSGARLTSTPSAAATTSPAVQQAASVEARLLALSNAVLAHPDVPHLGPARRRLVAGARVAHLDHLAALHACDPLARPLPSATPAVPAPVGKTGSVSTALTTLRTAERAATGTHRQAAEEVPGLPGLLFASLAVSTAGFATALADDSPPEPPAPPTTRVAPPAASPVSAEQDLLAQVHAMIYGYQVAIGNAPAPLDTRKQLATRLVDYQQLRDRLTTLILAAGAQPPAAAPAYQLPMRVSTAGAARALARRLEVALLPHLGSWVAASSAATHVEALDQLFAGAAAALTWGAGAPTWPGWPS